MLDMGYCVYKHRVCLVTHQDRRRLRDHPLGSRCSVGQDSWTWGCMGHSSDSTHTHQYMIHGGVGTKSEDRAGLRKPMDVRRSNVNPPPPLAVSATLQSYTVRANTTVHGPRTSYPGGLAPHPASSINHSKRRLSASDLSVCTHPTGHTLRAAALTRHWEGA